MVFLRLFGLLLGVSGLALLFIGITFGSAAVQDVPLTYALFAMLAGLLLVLGANAGERMSQKQRERRTKKEKKPGDGRIE